MHIREDINKITYLDHILQEAQRLYPSYENIERKATADCMVRFRDPVRGVDGRWIESMDIKKGTEVWVRTSSLSIVALLCTVHGVLVLLPEKSLILASR